MKKNWGTQVVENLHELRKTTSCFKFVVLQVLRNILKLLHVQNQIKLFSWIENYCIQLQFTRSVITSIELRISSQVYTVAFTWRLICFRKGVIYSYIDNYSHQISLLRSELELTYVFRDLHSGLSGLVHDRVRGIRQAQKEPCGLFNPMSLFRSCSSSLMCNHWECTKSYRETHRPTSRCLAVGQIKFELYAKGLWLLGN